MRTRVILISCIFLALWVFPIVSRTAVASVSQVTRPIVIITVDKLDGNELFASSLPSIRKLLGTSAVALMNIRSLSGLSDSASSYLTLGAGSRSSYPTPPRKDPLVTLDNSANSTRFRNWSIGSQGLVSGTQLGLAEIGWVANEALLEGHPQDPGRLGEILHRVGWQTCVIGNLDTGYGLYRPGGLIVMDNRGSVDDGAVGPELNELDPGFPYRQRFSPTKTLTVLKQKLQSQRVLVVEYGDFFRLDEYRDEMLPAQWEKLKLQNMRRFDQFLGSVLELQEQNGFALILVGPSVSKKGLLQKALLEPLVIRDSMESPGLLRSGTTKWTGVVANVDLVPTIMQLAGVQDETRLTGRVVSNVATQDYLRKIENLNNRLMTINANQRELLDWYIGIISIVWILALLTLLIRKAAWGRWLLTGLLTIPGIFILMPLLPEACWNVVSLILLIGVVTLLLTRVKATEAQMLLIASVTWGMLIVDQFCGWRLIRFSALGYSAAAGSRYYGLGNELMGVFLAAALLLADLLRRKFKRNGPALLVLAISLFVLSWPQLGAKFGGILAGTIGFSVYLIRLYRLNFRNKWLWIVLIGGFAVLASVGLWDYLRHPDQQTHIGRFVGLFFSKQFGQVGEIILRKFEMEIKLSLFSPWMRIIFLALGLGIVNRLILKRALVQPEERLVWQAILAAGLASYAVNDAGVLAFATCLAFGYTYMLLRRTAVKTA